MNKKGYSENIAPQEADNRPLADRVSDLTQSETRYRRLFEAARDGILLLNVDTGAITDANPFMVELLGYSHAELLGKELWQIGLFADQSASQAAFKRLYKDKYIRYEGLPLETRDGEPREVEFVSNVYRENGSVVIQCNIRDITERKTIERQLQRATKALEAAFERERQITVALQRPMLFQPAEDAFSGLAVQTAYATASDDALVGGDFWDTFAYNRGHVAFVLGDVMGHGLTSAIFTTELKHTLRAYIREHENPAQILFHMNQYIFQSDRLFREGINPEGNGSPVCVALAIVARESGAGKLAVAAMEPPVIVRVDNRTEQLAATGLPIGVRGTEQYDQVDFQLDPGDTLILTTDGITEARRGNEFLDPTGLARLAVKGNGRSLKYMADTVLNGARDFAGGHLHDDASIVLVRRTSQRPVHPGNHTDP